MKIGKGSRGQGNDDLNKLRWTLWHLRYFQMHFLERKLLYFDFVTEVCSLGTIWQSVIFISVNSHVGSNPSHKSNKTIFKKILSYHIFWIKFILGVHAFPVQGWVLLCGRYRGGGGGGGGGTAHKGHFLSPDSLAKDVFFGKYSLAKSMLFFRSP